ncbi:MAG: hypothetical protein LBN05_08835 [Oscillospiraceae bacterium]|jgi:hypothetical protein|nr:hypothetical protein [Oscillospiraceae bacterium]
MNQNELNALPDLDTLSHLWLAIKLYITQYVSAHGGGGAADSVAWGDITDKPDLMTASEIAAAILAALPTAVSQLTNDENFQNAQEVLDAISGAMAGKISYVIAPGGTLPDIADAASGTVYLIPDPDATDPNSSAMESWIAVGEGEDRQWVKTGDGVIDLSGYVKFSDITYITNEQIDEMFAQTGGV